MVEATGTTRRGRGARAAARQKRDVKMLPALKRNLPLTEPMNQEQIERMDAASMHILENVGVHFVIPSPLPIGNVWVPRWSMKRCFWIVTWCGN